MPAIDDLQMSELRSPLAGGPPLEPGPDVAAVVRLRTERAAEEAPGDPAPSVRRLMAEVRGASSSGHRDGYVIAREGGADADRAVGYCRWSIAIRDNPDVVWLDAYVTPEWRRRAVGRRLVEHALAQSETVLDEAAGRRIQSVGFDVHQTSHVGRSLSSRIVHDWKQPVKIVGRWSRLDLTGIDRASIDRRLAARRATLADRYRFECASVQEIVHRVDLDALCAVFEEIANLMPLEDLTLERETFGQEAYRSMVDWIERTDRASLIEVALDDADDGSPVGLTLVTAPRDEPWRVDQSDTGVVRRAQGRGIGSVLKLSMLARILDTMPEARVIQTCNAASNEAMIAINERLGFREHKLEHGFQMPASTLRGHLGRSNDTP